MARLPRSGTLAPERLRLWVMGVLWTELWRDRTWLWGKGDGALERDLRRWSVRAGMNNPMTEAHMDVLQAWYEYGLLGALAAVAFVAQIAPHLRWGDPWSAAWVMGAVFTLGHWPCRHPALGVTWLAIGARVVAA